MKSIKSNNMLSKSELKEKHNFDEYYHFQHCDKSGKTKGCGCDLCLFLHEYVKVKHSLRKLKKLYNNNIDRIHSDFFKNKNKDIINILNEKRLVKNELKRKFGL